MQAITSCLPLLGISTAVLMDWSAAMMSAIKSSVAAQSSAGLAGTIELIL
jgi:hypothetical protein